MGLFHLTSLSAVALSSSLHDQSVHVLLSSRGYFPGHNPGLVTVQLAAKHLQISRSDQSRADHVLQRVLARAEHLHQEEVEEQQTEAGPAGPGGGSACPHSEVRKISRTDRFLYWVTAGSSRELRRGERRKMIWRRNGRPGRPQTQCRSSGEILKFLFYIALFIIRVSLIPQTFSEK